MTLKLSDVNKAYSLMSDLKMFKIQRNELSNVNIGSISMNGIYVMNYMEPLKEHNAKHKQLHDLIIEIMDDKIWKLEDELTKLGVDVDN